MQHTHCFNFSHHFRDSACDLVLISEVVEHLPKQEYLFLYELQRKHCLNNNLLKLYIFSLVIIKEVIISSNDH
jgi:hypothetical protein